VNPNARAFQISSANPRNFDLSDRTWLCIFHLDKKDSVRLASLHCGDAYRHRTDNGNVSFRPRHDRPESCRVWRRFRSSFPQASRGSWAGFHAVSSGKTTVAVTGRDRRKSNRRSPAFEILSIAKNRVRTRARPRRSVWIWKYVEKSFLANRRRLARARDRRRRHAKPRAYLFFSAAHAAKDSGIALNLARSLGLELPLARATKDQYDHMVAEGLGELDKSGIAELTFKDRHKHSGDRV
jgi:hypothetical protein